MANNQNYPPGTAQHLVPTVSLRIQALRRPDFYHNDVCDYAEEGDILYDVFVKERKDTEPFGYTPFLQFPASLGVVHLGERFRGYVSVRNLTPTTLRQVRIKGVIGRAELQRFDMILDAADLTFGPHSSHDFIIEHTLTDMGTYNLSFSMDYKDDSMLEKNTRKLFTFPVEKALEAANFQVKYMRGTAYLKFTLKCVTTQLICLGRVWSTPGENLSLVPYPELSESTPWDSLMYPGEIRQFVFPYALASLTQSPHLDVGVVSFEWKRNFGEMGILQTNRISHKTARGMTDVSSSGGGFLDVLVERAPQTVRLQEEFDISLTVCNCGEASIEAVLSLKPEKLLPLAVTGPVRWLLGTLGPHKQTSVTLRLISLYAGFVSFLPSALEISDIQNPAGVLWPLPSGNAHTLCFFTVVS